MANGDEGRGLGFLLSYFSFQNGGLKLGAREVLPMSEDSRKTGKSCSQEKEADTFMVPQSSAGRP
jgi:hypothetical protein